MIGPTMLVFLTGGDYHGYAIIDKIISRPNSDPTVARIMIRGKECFYKMKNDRITAQILEGKTHNEDGWQLVPTLYFLELQG